MREECCAAAVARLEGLLEGELGRCSLFADPAADEPDSEAPDVDDVDDANPRVVVARTAPRGHVAPTAGARTFTTWRLPAMRPRIILLSARPRILQTVLKVQI